MIGIIDYGMGNLRSVENALHHLDQPCLISSDPSMLASCDKLILPGVGSFHVCMNNIRMRQLEEPIRNMVRNGKPLLGICLGMQMLFEDSEEDGHCKGFGFLKGHIIRMEEPGLTVPQIGWNILEWNHESPMQKYLSVRPYVYYVHSWYASEYEEKDLTAYSTYGHLRIPGIVQHGNVIGTQFHPEKSGEDGLKMLNCYAEEFA
ncbi:MAG: imidazole glycerol phosphate synthase subunit HisH [Erysipelotrichia bacterium]|nr:imidazole glycerol phosphate synthase subunit HisH [Erysipelotrichia bacterium]